MTNWIKHPVQMEGDRVLLLPLEEKHFEELVDVSQNETIWTFMPVKGTNKELLLKVLYEAVDKRDKKEQYPFIVIDKKTNKIIGCTRLLQLNEEHKNLEIGYTWFLPECWGKGYNEESKFLLLSFCFEELKTIRVQIIASAANHRSRKAIERIGAQEEGVLRNVIIRDGDKKSIAYYSILCEEWETVKHNLAKLYKSRYAQNFLQDMHMF